MAHSTPMHRGNSSVARSAPTPCGTPSTLGNRGIHRPVVQAQGRAYSTPSNSQMLWATSQVNKFQLKVEDYDKIVQYLEIPEHFALWHGARKKMRVGGSDDEEDPTVLAYSTLLPPLLATPTMILTNGPIQVVHREPASPKELYEEDIIELARQTLVEDLEREVVLIERLLKWRKSRAAMPELPPASSPNPAPHLQTLGKPLNKDKPVNKEVQANKENQPPNKTTKKGDEKQLPKPNLAQIYAKKLCQKANYKKELIANRDKWKSAELEEKKQARIDAAKQLAKRSRLDRKHSLKMDAPKDAKVEKKACLDHLH
ncbi:unnamed protein product [Calypogeia fissa]